MIIKDALHILFRRVQPELVIQNWLNVNSGESVPRRACILSDNPSIEHIFVGAMQHEFDHYTVDEASYAYRYAQNYELSDIGGAKDFGVFGLIVKSVENILTTDVSNECLVEYEKALQFRNLTHSIDPTIFAAAFLAKYDIEHGTKRYRFSWSPIIRTNNTNLHKILSKGMSENHFHIGGSSNAFMFSWICLMNHFSPKRKSEFENKYIDEEALDTVYTGTRVHLDSNYLLTFKAVCIRYFLYMLLHDQLAFLPNNSNEHSAKDTTGCERDKQFENLCKLKELLRLTEENCSLEMDEIDAYLETMRSFCEPVDCSGFIPDYALKEEPLAPKATAVDCDCLDVAVRDYERRLFRPLAGEQRFLYDLFKAIYTKDERLNPYWDLIYAYLLIYCRLRGELIQANDRIGFGNFLKFQNRKELFTASYPQYSTMRTGIAERVVLENPQVISFEGRFSPSSTPEALIDKINYLINSGTKSLCGVSDYYDENDKSPTKHVNEEKLRDKMNFVIHFPKRVQYISDKEEYELLSPRDSKLRERTMSQANAIIKARYMRPDILRYVVGIDACSSEIDCRPEVFACAIRNICSCRPVSDSVISPRLSDIRITYHAGEDFLDPISGMRSIDEALEFLSMKAGDRIGHALVLGIECQEWYLKKNHVVLMRRQELLDNMVWLQTNMSRFNINNRSAENEINNLYHELFFKIYVCNQDSGETILNSVDILQYSKSMSLRGDDPTLYRHNPLHERINFDEDWANIEPWQLCGRNSKEKNILSMLLNHCYHYNYKMKKASDVIMCYTVPKSIVDTVCELQEKLQYEIANKGIGIECNPSSNFLIGTFKDYLKHPIFKFNNRSLFPPYDVRFNRKNPHINASINTDDLGIFDTSLENEYAIMASALENYNYVTDGDIPRDNIYMWLDNIREIGVKQSFVKQNRILS